MNGKYVGIYSNVESVKPMMLERGFDDGSGPLYEGTVADFYPNFLDRLEQKGKQDAMKQIEAISELLMSKEPDVEALREHLDVDAFVRFWATESLLGFWDGYTNNQNNYFIYLRPSDSKFVFMPWGMDSLFTERMPLPPFFTFPKYVHKRAALPNRLYRVKEVQELYHETLNELIEKHWDEERLLADIDKLEAKLEPLVLKDNEKFKGAVEEIRTFIRERPKKLAAEMAMGPTTISSGPKGLTFFEQVGTAEITFETKWYLKEPKNPLELGDVKIKLVMNGKPVELSAAGGFARASDFPPVKKGETKPAGIQFHTKRKSSGKSLMLAIGLDASDFHPTNGEKTQVGGMVIEGGGWFGLARSFKLMEGKAVFDKAGMKEGDIIKGHATLSIVEIKEGKPARKAAAK